MDVMAVDGCGYSELWPKICIINIFIYIKLHAFKKMCDKSIDILESLDMKMIFQRLSMFKPEIGFYLSIHNENFL